MSPFEASLKGVLPNAGIRVIALAVARVETGWSASWGEAAQGDFWRIYLNDRSMNLRSGKTVTILPKHRIGLIPPVPDFRPDVATETKHAYLHFEPSELPAGLLGELFTAPVILPHEPSQHGLMTKLADLAGSARTAPAHVPFLAQAVANLIFATALSTLPVQARDRLLQALRGENPISPALARIRDRLHEPPSLDELAQLCGMSRRAFSEKFRHWTGRSPLQYQLRERLLQAEELLMFSEASIDSVAARTGFTDRYHFSKAFRRFRGYGPAAYRKQLQARRSER